MKLNVEHYFNLILQSSKLSTVAKEEKKSAESDFDSAFSMIVSGAIGCTFNAPRAAEDGTHTTYRTLVELD